MRGDIFKKTCEYILVLMMVCILLLTGCSESNDTDEDDMIKAEESSGISAVSLVIGSDNYEPYNTLMSLVKMLVLMWILQRKRAAGWG